MKVGFLGLGKLGLPVALAIEHCGHEVIGYDPAPNVRKVLDTRTLAYRELWAQDLLETTKIRIDEIGAVVAHSEIMFVAIQTPHDKEYEGVTLVPQVKKDFDYAYLMDGIRALDKEIAKQEKNVVVVIVSTVLPGTIRRRIKPIVQNNPYFKLSYNPFFIAMGTTMRDFLEPEFVLFGVDDQYAAQTAENFYRTIHKAPFFKTTLENAEIIKVLYNTYISTKIAFANTAMELCSHLPNTNVDDVMNALKLGKRRIISDAYLDGGMGDGGGCHPRDNIALSWLSDELGLSFNWFDSIIRQREHQTEWFATLIRRHAENLVRTDESTELSPVYLLGKTFKESTNITTGSPALLLAHVLGLNGVSYTIYDPYVDTRPPRFERGVYFISTRHAEFKDLRFPPGSVVLDPWRFIPERPDNEKVRVIGIGDNVRQNQSYTDGVI